MIVGHVKCGQRQKALELFEQMQQEDVLPNSVYASIVALEDGRCTHEQTIQRGWDSDVL
jgi:pentatricopeptide repeat protein